MEYKLFDDYITLQALLKELGIIQSGGAIKAYLAETTVLFNGEDEKRRGKKILSRWCCKHSRGMVSLSILSHQQTKKERTSWSLSWKARYGGREELNAKNKKDKKQNQAKKQTKPTKRT